MSRFKTRHNNDFVAHRHSNPEKIGRASQAHHDFMRKIRRPNGKRMCKKAVSDVMIFMCTRNSLYVSPRNPLSPLDRGTKETPTRAATDHTKRSFSSTKNISRSTSQPSCLHLPDHLRSATITSLHIVGLSFLIGRRRHGDLAVPALRSQSWSIAEQDERNRPNRNGNEPERVQSPLWRDRCEELQDNERQSASEYQATTCGCSES